eukprot:gene7191-7405_t
MRRTPFLMLLALAGATITAAASGPATPNPKDAFKTAMSVYPNVWQTRNFFIGAYHYVQCFANDLIIPSSTQEVASAVSFYYNKTRHGQPVTLRVSRPMFHSSQNFPCPNSPLKPPAISQNIPPAERRPTEKISTAMPLSVGVMQTKLNKILAKDYKKWTMRVQPGIRYTEFLAQAEKAGMSVQIGTPTAYAGLTLAGVLATTSHGSGDKTTSAIWDTLLEIVWVDGTGKIRVSKPGDAEFKAMVGGLGVLGVMTEFVMQMTPKSATTLITVRRSDTNMMKDIEELLKISPHMLIFWRPDIHSFKAFILKKAAPGAKVIPGTVASLLPSIKDREKGAGAFKLLSSSLNDDSEAYNFLCPLQTEASLSSAWASVNGTGFENITGSTNTMQASECDEHCNWNENEVFFGTAQDVEFTAEFDQLANWINDVKKIIKTELFENGKTPYRCMGPGYLWIRFGSGFDGYTATNAGMKRPVFLQSTWLRSRATPDMPIKYQFIIDVLEQLTLCKYNARPHWGKNHERTFLHPTCKVKAKYPKFDELVKLQTQHDPARLFEPRLFSRVAAGDTYKLSPGCSLWQRCYCEQDIHCSRGHKCVKSKTFPEYKVCKPAQIKDVPGKLLPLLMASLSGGN